MENDEQTASNEPEGFRGLHGRCRSPLKRIGTGVTFLVALAFTVGGCGSPGTEDSPVRFGGSEDGGGTAGTGGAAGSDGGGSDGSGGSTSANVLWSSTEQTQGFPFNFDWTTCEKPIAAVVDCTNGDWDGSEFDSVADPAPGGSGLAIRQYADLSPGGGRSQGALLSQLHPTIEALFDNQEEIWIYTEYYFPAPVVGSGWLHFLGFQQTGTAGRVANNPAINFWSEEESGGGYYPGDMEIGIYWVGDTQLQKATAPLPVGKWVEFEFMYKRSSGNNARDGAAQIWIDNVLVADQTEIETWQNGYQNLEIYWNLYGESWSADWDNPTPEYYIRNIKVGDARMSTGHLR